MGELLRSSGVEVIEFRASIVIGSGSLSFEIIRALVERLPVMVCPRWVSKAAQPIGIEDLTDYLLAALDLPYKGSRIIEIGGPEKVSYRDIMEEYARQRGLRRVMIPIPVFKPAAFQPLVGACTPVYARIGRKLIDSIRNATVVKDPSALTLFAIKPKGLCEMITRAMQNEDNEFAVTRWSDALSSTGIERSWGGVRLGNRLVDSRTVDVAVPAEEAFRPIRRIAARRDGITVTGCGACAGLLTPWSVGLGLRRGRRIPDSVRVGDTLDFWRVEAIEKNRKLHLFAEMKLPGRAWLEFEVEPHRKKSLIRQTAIFDPMGLAGLAYWYGLYLFHRLIFAKMLGRIAEACQEKTRFAQ